MQQKPQWHIDIEKGPYEALWRVHHPKWWLPLFFLLFMSIWLYDVLMYLSLEIWIKVLPSGAKLLLTKKNYIASTKRHTHPTVKQKALMNGVWARIIWVTQLPPIFAVFSRGCHKMPGAWRSSTPSGCDASGGFPAVEDDGENLRGWTPCLPDLLGRSRPGCNRFCSCDGIDVISAFFLFEAESQVWRLLLNPPKQTYWLLTGKLGANDDIDSRSWLSRFEDLIL